jgi:CDP-diacylglycerol--glycerol-3-phosphate 3-phosphatidyltransferase
MQKNIILGEPMVKYIANIVTGCRIFGSAVLLFLPVLSVAFYCIYIICGLSDMIDGTIARKTNSTSEIGSKMDTIADLVFVIVSLIKILPIITIPKWLWLWGGVIAIMRISNIIWGYISKKQFISLHTVMNKVTGLLLFILPLTLSFVEVKYGLIIVCFIATFAAIQEGIYITINCENE